MIINPVWQREIALSKVRLQVAVMDLQMEFTQGASVYNGDKNGTKIRGKKERQPVGSIQENGSVPVNNTETQRSENPDPRANDQGSNQLFG